MNRSVTHTGTLHVDAVPEHAFQLFTAPGEKLWIDDWDPVILSGGDGRERGAVFVTDVADNKAYWVVVGEILGIPDEVTIGAVIALGHPDRPFGPVKRRPVAEVIHREHWQDRPERS